MTETFQLICDVASFGASLNVNSAWIRNSIDVDSVFVETVDGRFEAQTLILHTNSGSIEQEIILPDSVFLGGQTITLGFWVKKGEDETPEFGSHLNIFDAGTTEVGSLNVQLLNNYTLYQFEFTFSNSLTDTSYFIKFSTPTGAVSSGDRVIAARVHSALTNGILDMFPEWNYTQQDRKIENSHRVRSGGRFVYKWGDYFALKFGVRFVESLDQSIISSWWNTNKNLLWIVDTWMEVESVQIMNRALPIGKFILPHNTFYEGAIELETY